MFLLVAILFLITTSFIFILTLRLLSLEKVVNFLAEEREKEVKNGNWYTDKK